MSACRPARPARLLALSYLLSLPFYFVTYWATSSHLGFLPSTWMSGAPIIDIIMGFVFFTLNFHSFLDFFFAVNGGLSACLLSVIHQNRDNGITPHELSAMFRSRQGYDKITAWRLPRLVQTGYLTNNPDTDQYRLTAKGHRMASAVRLCKLVLNIRTGT